MKIQSIPRTFNNLVQVREKLDGQSSQKDTYQQHHDSEQKKHDPSQPESTVPSVEKINEERVSEAVESFQTDTLAQANGLNASVVGNGPGLKVVLKDGSGSIVRQLSGEEFLKLCESVSQEGRTRGKILDQKL